MSTLHRSVLAIALMLALSSVPTPVLAISGQWGVAFGIDAPWRLEPVPVRTSSSSTAPYTYGSIPITITFRQAIAEMGRMNYTKDGTGTGAAVGVAVGELVNPLLGELAGYETAKNLSGNVGDRIRRGLFNAGDSLWVGAVTLVKVEELTGINDGSYEGQTTYIRPGEFREVERKRHRYSTLNEEPPHEICRPFLGERCNSTIFDITDTDEWHGLFWYTPKIAVSPGRNIHLEVTVLTQNTDGSDGHRWVSLLVVHAGEEPLPRFGPNWLNGDLHYHSQMTANEGEYGYSYRDVARTLGALGLDFVFATDHASNSEQALSRIFTGRCGDVPDAFICTPSANAGMCSVSQRCIPYLPGRLARDLNASKFAMAKNILYGADGATQALTRDNDIGYGGRFRSTRVLPQIYMGEEVDVQPEMSAREQQDGVIYYGDGLRYWWANDDDPDLLAETHLFDTHCIMDRYYKNHGRYPSPAPDLPAAQQTAELRQLADACRAMHSMPYADGDRRSFIVKDFEGAGGSEKAAQAISQGSAGLAPTKISEFFAKIVEGFLLNEDAADAEGVLTPAREHLVYLPTDTSPSGKGFIASSTSRFGGATKKLADVIREVEANQSYAFLAHPLHNGGPGGAGPDIPPYSQVALDRAWSSAAILGLQFWNEDYHRFANAPTGPDGHTVMRESKKSECLGLPCKPDNTVANGHTSINQYPSHELWGPFHVLNSATGTASYQENVYFPWKWPSYQSVPDVLMLYDGAFIWDQYLRKGLIREQAAALSWLRKGEPRKWFMAGGNDAHGDFNYRQSGQMTAAQRWGTDRILDTAIGRVHNMVHVKGAPEAVPDLPGAVRYRNQAVIQALAAGDFAVTNGPALRIAIDRNRNGRIDDEDFQMGSTFNLYPGEHIPVLVEWSSTQEFGPISAVDIYVGDSTFTFAPKQHGPGIPARLQPRIGQEFGGPLADYGHYKPDPSGALKIQLADAPGVTPDTRLHGIAQIMLSPKHFVSELTTRDGELFYIRAVAKTRSGTDAAAARECPGPYLAGSSCGDRFAYSNPIWGRTHLSCPAATARDSLSLDGDNNGVPDVCERSVPDPCPLQLRTGIEIVRPGGGVLVQPTQPSGGNVVLYENRNFGGRSVTLGMGQTGAADFPIASIKVPKGVVAMLFEHSDSEGGYGRFVDLLEDHADLSSLNSRFTYVTVGPSTNGEFIWARNSMANGRFELGHWARARASGGPATPANAIAVVAPPLPAHPPARSCQVSVKSAAR